MRSGLRTINDQGGKRDDEFYLVVDHWIDRRRHSASDHAVKRRDELARDDAAGYRRIDSRRPDKLGNLGRRRSGSRLSSRWTAALHPRRDRSALDMAHDEKSEHSDVKSLSA